ncbi:MAG: O-antigen ligase family protein [Caldiserica bacterium]|jgi:putative inorganic carbon (HCO3(-)) transporter|nr:O-antigen ligase family protein [Caldisericota bacterium]MDH7561949.1 O-antigen ligase family protein [Caldisericota bacterium]
MSSLNKGSLLDSLISIFLLIFLFVYPLFLHPAVYSSALGFIEEGAIKNLDFFYEPRSTLLFWSCSFFLVLWSVKFLKTGDWGHRDRGMDLFLALMILTALASTLFSLEPLTIFGEERRREGFLTLLSYFSLFLFAQDFLSKEGWKKLASIIILASGFLVALYGLLQAFSLEILPRDFIRQDWTGPFSTIGNPIFLGSYLLLLIPLPFTLLSEGKTIKNFFLVSLSLFFLACLVLTGSRGAWLGFVALLVFFLLSARGKKWFIYSFAGVSLILVALLFFLNPGSVNLKERASNIADLNPRNTLVNRWNIWIRALPAILRYPVFGWGPDSFGVAFPQFSPEESLSLFGSSFAYVDKAHNDLIQIAVTLGIGGLIAYILFLVRLFSLSFPTRRSDPFSAYVLPGIFGYLVSLQLSFSVVSVAPLFWVLGGMATGGLKENAPKA